MRRFETTRYGVNGEATTTVIAAEEHVLIDNVRPEPPRYPDTRPGVVRLSVAHQVAAFQELVDEVSGHLVEDESRPMVSRGESVRLSLGELAEAVALAVAADEDLTDADTRFDWCMRFVGLDPDAYRTELGPSSPLGGS